MTSNAYDKHRCLKDFNNLAVYHNTKLQEAIQELKSILMLLLFMLITIMPYFWVSLFSLNTSLVSIYTLIMTNNEFIFFTSRI